MGYQPEAAVNPRIAVFAADTDATSPLRLFHLFFAGGKQARAALHLCC
jgi:hypothetical protein